MTLRPIVAALGGELYCGGARANVPAPGHSASDRSVSLMLSGDRVIVHGFGECDWRLAQDHLRRSGLIDAQGRVVGGASSLTRVGQVPPDRATRVEAARRIWDGGGRLGPASLSGRHLRRRAISLDPADIVALRHHPEVSLSVYRRAGRRQPALVAAIHDPAGALTAVELVYLAPSGRRDDRLRTPRKTVGVMQAGSAVRLFPAAPEMLTGEGVMTVLSASERFGLPAWALMSARNLAAWVPPPLVRTLVIAADRGPAGEAAARRLAERLERLGVTASIALPPRGVDDWNALAVGEREKEGG